MSNIFTTFAPSFDSMAEIRVLLTRARQGMILCVPKGSKDDPTRQPEFYDSTYEYLKSLGIDEI